MTRVLDRFCNLVQINGLIIQRKKVKLTTLIPSFSDKNYRLSYNKKIHVPVKAGSFVRQVAHDSNAGGPFKDAEALSQ